nr:uncharacterized protein LOC129052337 [Pongo abelii]XP_054398585.1 uncharacterized protein LOC129052337 [Pongo abelii]
MEELRLGPTAPLLLWRLRSGEASARARGLGQCPGSPGALSTQIMPGFFPDGGSSRKPECRTVAEPAQLFLSQAQAPLQGHMEGCGPGPGPDTCSSGTPGDSRCGQSAHSKEGEPRPEKSGDLPGPQLCSPKRPGLKQKQEEGRTVRPQPLVPDITPGWHQASHPSRVPEPPLAVASTALFTGGCGLFCGRTCSVHLSENELLSSVGPVPLPSWHMATVPPSGRMTWESKLQVLVVSSCTRISPAEEDTVRESGGSPVMPVFKDLLVNELCPYNASVLSQLKSSPSCCPQRLQIPWQKQDILSFS